ncbi:MAG: hypothetical protein QM765_38915 [Myxococcales bacterium]
MKTLDALVQAKLAATPGLETAQTLWSRLWGAWVEGGAPAAEALLEQLLSAPQASGEPATRTDTDPASDEG